MIFCFDIDDTILFSKIDELKNYELVGINEDLIKKINYLYENGNTIILHTGRHWNHLQVTIYQLSKCNIKYHTLIMGKPYADYYIDDKAILPEDFLNISV